VGCWHVVECVVKKLGRTAVRPRLFTIGLTKLNLFVKQFKA
jgi:hypothetical protein